MATMRRLVPLFTAALMLATMTAHAQTQPPPLSEPTPPTATPPPVEPAPAPPVAPIATPPVPPTSPVQTLTPEAPPAAPLALEATPPPAPPRPVPFYQKAWFWAAVGVVVATAVVITLATRSSGPGTPDTTLGDMHAF
jgi:hypothetical protein